MSGFIRLTLFPLLMWAALSLPAWGQPAGSQPQILCPVMGAQVNRGIYVDYQGQRIYFCCAACIDLFKKNPEKYLQEMKKAGVSPEKAPSDK
ncbi:MAG: YHS domain-containing protein [Desulfobaccales bacterium]